MKSFKQFLQERASYKVYCDMDGVLVDFLGGVMKELDISNIPSQDELDNFLSTLQGSSKTFWSELEWMSDGKKLWDTLKDLNTEILSACPSNCRVQPNVEKGKRLWCKKNLGISKGINISTRKDKVNFANKKHILIDDYIKNINEWKRAGGIGIHHRTARATLVELKNILIG